MAAPAQVGNESGPAAVERVEWLVQRQLGAPVPADEPGATEGEGRWQRFLRDGHPPRFRAPGGAEIIEVGADGPESFASTAVFGLGLSARFEPALAALPGRSGWRCYVTSGGSAPAAMATFAEGPLVLIAVDASAEAGRRSPARMALLHRAVGDAAEARARTIAARVDEAADAPRKETAAGFLLAGFKAAYHCPPWVDEALPAS